MLLRMKNLWNKITQRLWLTTWLHHCARHISQAWANSADVIGPTLVKTGAGRRLVWPVGERKTTSNDTRIIRKLFHQLLTQCLHLSTNQKRLHQSPTNYMLYRLCDLYSIRRSTGGKSLNSPLQGQEKLSHCCTLINQSMRKKRNKYGQIKCWSAPYKTMMSIDVLPSKSLF